MKISILCSERSHPVNDWLLRWAKSNSSHEIEIVDSSNALAGGDFLFLVSCHEVIRERVRSRYRHSLVLHASALPQGRGMSPHVWQLLEDRREIPLSLLDAEDAVDSGDIWRQVIVRFEGHELFDEINAKIFDAEIELMSWALANCDTEKPRKQVGEPTYYRKRTPEDSRIDPEKTIASQFDLLRVADSARYPAFFDFRGTRYRIAIEKMKE